MARFPRVCRVEAAPLPVGVRVWDTGRRARFFRAGSGLGSLEPLSPQHISQPEIERLDFRSVRNNDAKEPFGVVPREWYCPNPGSVPEELASTSSPF